MLAGRLWYPISQSVCGESVRSSPHSGDAASRLPQSQVHLCEFRRNLNEFRQPLSETLTHCRDRSVTCCFFCTQLSVAIPLLPLFLQRKLHFHGDLDQQHQAGGALAQPGPKPISALRVRGHHGGVFSGELPSLVPY